MANQTVTKYKLACCHTTKEIKHNVCTTPLSWQSATRFEIKFRNEPKWYFHNVSCDSTHARVKVKDKQLA